jgi:hypothetical protein
MFSDFLAILFFRQTPAHSDLSNFLLLLASGVIFVSFVLLVVKSW